ncbi:MAG: DUF3604 domain-containing protein [Myxococcales bacterium]|jgi:hypothetical protein|nr:DUF3604 domain-containing protein [Myxococcales bacterium]
MEERGTDEAIANVPDPTSAATPNRFHQCAEFTETRRPFFGELHVHTTNSLDADLKGTRLAPRDAYRFAQGLPVSVEAVGIEHRAIHLIPTILEQFRGQVSMRTRPDNTKEPCYRTFL